MCIFVVLLSSRANLIGFKKIKGAIYRKSLNQEKKKINNIGMKKIRKLG